MDNAMHVKIGWASCDITPYGREVSLYGQGNMRITKEIRDKICVTALALQRNDGHIIMVSCDLTYIPSYILEGVRNELNSLDGFNTKNLIINATHTHTAPYLERHRPSELWGELFDFGSQFVGELMTPEEFSSFVIGGIVDAAQCAWQKRSSGGVAFELAYPAISFSRRVTYNDGSCTMYGQTTRDDFTGFEEASDPGMELMYTFDDAAKLTGVVVNVACPSQAIELSMAVSADYAGEVQTVMQKKYGVPVLMQIAPAGDQSPRDLLRMKWRKSHKYFPRDHRDDGYMKIIARRVVDAIELRIDDAQADIEWSPLITNAQLQIALPLNQVTLREYEQALPIANALEAAYHAHGNKFAPGEQPQYMKNRGIVIRYEYQQKTNIIPIEINALRIGDVAFITNPFELYTVYGQRIKALNPAGQTFCIQLSNGSRGYLPSVRAARSGDYGAQPYSCWVGPKGGEMLVNESVKLLQELFNK